jgi:hypothetical protein
MFENEYYQEGGKSPKFKGKLTVNGVDKEFAVWPKENNGKTFFSGKISEPFVKSTPNGSAPKDPLKKAIESKHDDMQEDYGDLPF